MVLEVVLQGESRYTEPLGELANNIQSRFHFQAHRSETAVPLDLVERSMDSLFIADKQRGIAISTANARKVCAYASISTTHYHLLCSILGLTQWRTMDSNPLLVPEDFHHISSESCVFAHRDNLLEQALLMENPQVCWGCREFFDCLGMEHELLTVDEIFHEIRKASIHLN